MSSPEVEGFRDPRWEWIDVTAVGDPRSVWIRGVCKHLEQWELRTVPDDELVCFICDTCEDVLELPSDER